MKPRGEVAPPLSQSEMWAKAQLWSPAGQGSASHWPGLCLGGDETSSTMRRAPASNVLPRDVTCEATAFSLLLESPAPVPSAPIVASGLGCASCVTRCSLHSVSLPI